MSHTTYNYTREKLGFEPDREERRLAHYAGVQRNGHHHGHNGQQPGGGGGSRNGDGGAGGAGGAHNTAGHGSSGGGANGYNNDYEDDLIGGIYEENLSKFKGLFLIIFFFSLLYFH